MNGFFQLNFVRASQAVVTFPLVALCNFSRVLPSCFIYVSSSLQLALRPFFSLHSLISPVSQDKRELRVAVELQTGCHGDCQRLCVSPVCVCVCVTCNNGSSIRAWEAHSIMSQKLLEVN